MLHAKTTGINFFVVHLSPSQYKFRVKEVEIITTKIKAIKKENQHYMVLGDFNSHSPFDGDFDKEFSSQHNKELDENKNANLLDDEISKGFVERQG